MNWLCTSLSWSTQRSSVHKWFVWGNLWLLGLLLLWSVCDMVCNYETSDSSLYMIALLDVVFETIMQLIHFVHVSVNCTNQCLSQGSWTNQAWLACSDIWIGDMECKFCRPTNEIETCRYAGELNFLSVMWSLSNCARLTFNVQYTFDQMSLHVCP